MEVLRSHTGNADAGSLDGDDLRHMLFTEQAIELFSHFIEEINVHLMVQKAVHFEHIPGPDNAVFPNSLFHQLHSSLPFFLSRFTGRSVQRRQTLCQ